MKIAANTQESQARVERLLPHCKVIRRSGVAPVMYPYGETVIAPRDRMARAVEEQHLTRFKNRPRDGTWKIRTQRKTPNLHGGLFFSPATTSSPPARSAPGRD